MASPFRNDEPLWYNVGVWGQLGYAVPNFADRPTTLNNNIASIVDMTGRNLAAIMMHEDAWLRTPPSINTLTRIHKLVVRARALVSARAVPPGKANMEAVHTTPSAEDFLIFPVPFFRVRNRWMKEWCGLILACLSECVQHTENFKAYEISTAFGGLYGQYIDRVYRMMCTEMFGITATVYDAAAGGFALTDVQLAAYNPYAWFTSTELIDVVAPDFPMPTEQDYELLGNGIPASKLAGLARYPSGTSPLEGIEGPASPTNGGTNGAASSAAFPQPIGP